MTTYVDTTRTDKASQSRFVQIPSELLTGIPSDELHVYLILCDFAGKKSVCWPSDRTIGKMIGRSQDTASRIIGRLAARGLIKRERVDPTDENPTGRVLITNRRVPAAEMRHPLPRVFPTPPAKGRETPTADLRQDPDKKKEKQNGPLAQRNGHGPEMEDTPLPQAEVTRLLRAMASSWRTST